MSREVQLIPSALTIILSSAAPPELSDQNSPWLYLIGV
jgi:hypothetical protein